MSQRRIQPTGSKNSKIMILLEAPDRNESALGAPVGYESKEKLSYLCRKSGFTLEECYVTTVSKRRITVQRNAFEFDNVLAWFAKTKKELTDKHILREGKYILPQLEYELTELADEIERVKPNIILACGNLALWATTGRWGISNWRGSLEENICGSHHCKVIPTIHPLAVHRNSAWTPIVRNDFARTKHESETAEFPIVVENFILAPTFNQVVEHLDFFEDMLKGGLTKFAFDIENPAGYIDCIGFAWNETDAICIPFMEGHQAYFSLDEEAYITYRLYKIMTHPNFYGITQNGQHEAQYIYEQYCFTPNFCRDTMIDHHALVPTGSMSDKEDLKKDREEAANKKNIGFLSSIYTTDHRYWKHERLEADNPLDGWRYNARDCVRTIKIHNEEQRRIDSADKQRFVADFKQSLFLPCVRMSRTGLLVDVERQKTIRGELEEYIQDRQRWIEYSLSHPLNLNSSKQMKDLFYVDLQQKPVKKRNANGVWVDTCDKEALHKIVEREPLLKPLCDKIEEARSCKVYINTFIDGAILTDDNRMTCIVDITGTITDRFAHKKTSLGLGTNMGNIPKFKKKEDPDALELPQLREIFIPPPNYTIWEGDCNSADARIVAKESRCKELQAMFDAGAKVYVELAKEYFHDATIDKNHWSYDPFKRIVHGTHYMGQARTMAVKTGFLIAEIDRIQKWYFGKCPEIKRWHEKIINQVNKYKYVENVFGRRIWFLGKISEETYRQAVACIPQSTVAWIIDMGFVALDELIQTDPVYARGTINDQVHDSLVGCFPTEEREIWLPEIERCLSVELPYKDSPLTIPVEIATSEESWGKCK